MASLEEGERRREEQEREAVKEAGKLEYVLASQCLKGEIRPHADASVVPGRRGASRT